MFNIQNFKSRELVADTQTTGPVIDVDHALVEKHGDMMVQFKNPSALRKQHDLQAIEDRPTIETGRLHEYMLVDLKNKGDSVEIARAKQSVNETLIECYEKSPTFRRIFNHAVSSKALEPGGRYTIEIQGHDNTSRRSTLVLIDTKTPRIEKHIPEPTYRSLTGDRACSAKRNVIEQVVFCVTRLPNTEKGHPRGPVQEYSNIILKEIGRGYEPAMVSVAAAVARPESSKGRTSPRGLLNSVLVENENAIKKAQSPKGKKFITA